MDTIQITKRTKDPKQTDRLKLIHSIKLMKKGQCVEYRGSEKVGNIRSLVSQAQTWLDKTISSTVVAGGMDIYCE